MKGSQYRGTWPVGAIALVAWLLLACGGAAAPESALAPEVADPAAQTTASVVPQASANPAPKANPRPSAVTSARDSITLVMPEEPVNVNSLYRIGAALNATVTRGNLQDPLTWQSGDDLRIVPTGATESWEQIDADTWRFQLRRGVKFHNGEDWNADNSLPSFAVQGGIASEGGGFNYTGPFEAVKVDDYTVDLNCAAPCPIFPNTAFSLNFEAPGWLAGATADDLARRSVGFGPYRQVEWKPGVSITQTAYEDYVPAGDHFEFQRPFIPNVTWIWRPEPTAIGALVRTGEADIGWDIGASAVGLFPPEMIRAGASAETYSLSINTIWHPELKKQAVRQAMAHAVNCQEMVEFLYNGLTACRGSIIWPGVIGATEANTAPYEYDPNKSRRLLADAGYNPENTITITTQFARVAKQVQISEFIQAYLTDVGMNVEYRVVSPSVWSSMSRCGIGQAVQEVIAASGRDPDQATPTSGDLRAALDKGVSNCAPYDILGRQPSNATLDFGRHLQYYMNCASVRSMVCDLNQGGIQGRIYDALASTGAGRQGRLEVLADRFHDDVFFLSLFDLPIIYAVDPQVNWQPRQDPNVRVSGIWFSE